MIRNILSHSVGCLLILWMVPLSVQKLVSLISYLYIFAFVIYTFGVMSKNLHQDQCQGDYLLYFLLG